MTENSCAIVSMSVLDGPANGIGIRLLAIFDLDYAGLSITNCKLVENEDGSTCVKGPAGHNHKKNLVRVQFVDPAVELQVRRRAASAYTGLTGRVLVVE